MVRVIIKGGVWKNTEDEILKAAIMKYGKNQWSRIASLLHRKSAKQCKARWYEWLDPRIKKTEWSREEDEKLLHLAKIMPTQWRTIAPIVGRTAAQCLERYEHLLDEAQRRAEGIEEADTLKEAKKLKPGEVDPTPETKPARPDPIDMDEDELEMLSEARARLANTQGKKAKRKAREKQLSEARRLASLQKRRELRAAGIVISTPNFRAKRRVDVDYNTEIPFEKPTPAGFHDPTEDRFDKNSVEKTADQRRDQREWEERQKDKEKLKKRKAEDNPESIFAAKHEKKRSKMVLPDPQISDKDLEDIVKIGHVTDSIRELVDTNPTSTLLTDYTESARKTPAARTLRTPSFAVDSVAKAADDLLALTNVETPLKGGLNTPLHTLEFVAPGSTRQIVQTPNTVLAAVAATPRSIVEQTPGSIASSTPSSTPFRDQLNINQDSTGANLDDLRKQLRTLPKPKNDFEVVLPDDEAETEEPSEEWIEDAAERDERKAQLIAKRREQELKKRTQVIQRNLPKPSKPNEQYKKRSAVQNDLAKADDMIKTEMYILMEWDIFDKKPIEEYSREQLDAAAELIHKECPTVEAFNSNMVAVINTCASELIMHADRFTRLSNLNKKEQIDALSSQFKLYYDWMTQNSKKTGKLEKKVKIKLGGYQAIATGLTTKIESIRNEISNHLIEHDTFTKLEQYENISIQHRLQKLVNEVKSQEEREKELQKRYSALENRAWELEEMARRADATISAAPVNYNENQ